jgi:hypothetical protein
MDNKKAGQYRLLEEVKARIYPRKNKITDQKLEYSIIVGINHQFQ